MAKIQTRRQGAAAQLLGKLWVFGVGPPSYPACAVVFGNLDRKSFPIFGALCNECMVPRRASPVGYRFINLEVILGSFLQRSTQPSIGSVQVGEDAKDGRGQGQ